MSVIFAAKPKTHERTSNVNLLQYAKSNREEGFFNDVCVDVEAENIPANRLILSCNSSYFEKIFKTQGHHETTLKIEGVKGKCVKAIIDFFYSELIEINSKNVMDLLEASDYLQIDEIKHLCLQFLQSCISPHNSLALLKTVRLYDSTEFANQVFEFISAHFEDVTKSNDFQLLSSEEFLNIFSKLNRNYLKESDLYQALTNWIQSDVTTRQKEFANLFQQVVDFHKLDIDFFENVLLNEPLIKQDNICHQKVLNVFSSLLKEQRARQPLNVQARPLPPSPFSKIPQNQLALTTANSLQSRSPNFEFRKSKVIALGSTYKSNSKKVRDVFHLHGSALADYPDLPAKTNWHSSLNFCNVIFYIGGAADTAPTNKVWKMDLKKQMLQWKQVAPMKQSRCKMGATLHLNGLAVAGGCTDFWAVLRSAEIYDADKNKWKRLSPMKSRRLHNALVSCQDCLYSIGGTADDDDYPLDSVEKLSSIEGKWENVQSMERPRSRFAAVACNKMIYAIGGLSGELSRDSDAYETLKSVERYDPVRNSWSFVKDLLRERYDHLCCVLNETIFVFGGKDQRNCPILEIECYDLVNNFWFTAGRLSNDILGQSIVAA